MSASPEPTPPRRRRRKPVTPDVSQVVEEYLLNRSAREKALVFENLLKSGLMDVLEASGEPDGEEGEHRRITLPKPLSFTTFKTEKGTVKTIVAVQRQKRKGSMSLNEDRTLAYLAKRKLTDSCTAQITVINEDAVLAANFEGTISDADLKALYDEGKPTYAFNLIEE